MQFNKYNIKLQRTVSDTGYVTWIMSWTFAGKVNTKKLPRGIDEKTAIKMRDWFEDYLTRVDPVRTCKDCEFEKPICEFHLTSESKGLTSTYRYICEDCWVIHERNRLRRYRNKLSQITHISVSAVDEIVDKIKSERILKITHQPWSVVKARYKAAIARGDGRGSDEE